MKDRDWIVLGIIALLWFTRKTSSGVIIPGVMQDCNYSDGSHFEMPVSDGPCPSMNDNGYPLVV